MSSLGCRDAPAGCAMRNDAERAMTATDLSTAATWHLAHFPNSFYASLGRRFLECYYLQFVRSPHAFARVAQDERGLMVSYLVGTLDDRSHRRWAITHHGIRQLATGVVCLAARPGLWPGFARRRALWYLRRAVAGLRRTFRQGGREETFGELVYLITHDSVRRTGIGSSLTRSYLNAAASRSARWAVLLTPANDERARRFYSGGGWQDDGERSTRDGFTLRAYRHPLGTHDPA